MYFVTVCTKDKRHFFGQIVDGEFQPSAMGEVAKNEWLKTGELRADMNLILDEFVVMPNHFHGIIFIGGNQYNCAESGDNKFGAQSKNLASIIRGFKMAVTTFARKNNIDFAWQERFHDHVIRDNEALQNIRGYIYNNPANWGDDELNVADVETQGIAETQSIASLQNGHLHVETHCNASPQNAHTHAETQSIASLQNGNTDVEMQCKHTHVETQCFASPHCNETQGIASLQNEIINILK